jgi:hypothetical protein
MGPGVVSALVENHDAININVPNSHKSNSPIDAFPNGDQLNDKEDHILNPN